MKTYLWVLLLGKLILTDWLQEALRRQQRLGLGAVEGGRQDDAGLALRPRPVLPDPGRHLAGGVPRRGVPAVLRRQERPPRGAGAVRGGHAVPGGPPRQGPGRLFNRLGPLFGPVLRSL